tara:strand:- start:312 stop:821 length:510 start_codon:yes stop_codon:yes gene_type:complete
MSILILHDLLARSRSVLSDHIYLRCRLGLHATFVNNINFDTIEDTLEFINNIFINVSLNINTVKKQIVSLLLYTEKDNELILASKMLSMSDYKFSIFVIAIHILFIMDITNMERNGLFYNYITGTLRHSIDSTTMKDLLIEEDNIITSRREGMVTFLQDFSHFFSLFIN